MSLKSFLKEYESLKLKFPARDRTYYNVVNCDYGEDIFNSKDCFWVFNGADLVDCMYNTDGYKEVDDVECDNGVLSERCFESTDFAECTNCNHVELCVRCYDSYFCYMCEDCNDCFGCSNLVHKSYCIYNVQHTKAEYKQKIKELLKISQTEAYKKLENVKKKFPRVNSYYDDATNSDYADYVYFVKTLYYCFDCSHSQDLGYMMLSHYCRDVWDGIYALECESSAGVSYSSSCFGCYEVEKCARCYDSFFLYECNDCNDCFGCAYLTNKHHCILNVQYTEAEYNKKVKEIKKEIGFHLSAKNIGV